MTVFLVLLPLLVSSNPMLELREEMEDTPVLGDREEEDREEGDLAREEINEEEMLMHAEEDRIMKEVMGENHL